MPFIVNRNMRTSCVETLRKIDSNIYFSQNCDKIYSKINAHPDIQIHFVDDKTAFTPPELFDYYRNILPAYITLKKGNKGLGGTYPDDVAYNVARIGKNVILNEKYADKNIIDYYLEKNYKIINVNQGYAKCNICTDGELAITEDEGIYSALIKNGIKTLKIPPGNVRLYGFDYGFIGGASGNKEKNIFFCGTLKNTSVSDMIKDFLKENNCEIITLDEEELTDYGSIIYFE